MRESSHRSRARRLRRLPSTAALLALALAAAACGGSSHPDPTPTAQITLSGATTLNATYEVLCHFYGEKGFEITMGPREESRVRADPTLFLSFSDYAGSSGYETLLVANLPGKAPHMTQGRGGAHVDITATALDQPIRSVLAGTFSGNYQSAAGTTHVAGTFSGCIYPGALP